MFTVGLRLKHQLRTPCKRLEITRYFATRCAKCLSQHQNVEKPYRLPGSQTASKAQPIHSNERANGGRTNTNDPLVFNALSDRDQRKADLTILKEMAKYLWPKVSR